MTFLAARWVVIRFAIVDGRRLVAIGCIALLLLLGAELMVGVFLRGLSPLEALIKRDVLSACAYYESTGLFAMMPWLVVRWRTTSR